MALPDQNNTQSRNAGNSTYAEQSDGGSASVDAVQTRVRSGSLAQHLSPDADGSPPATFTARTYPEVLDEFTAPFLDGYTFDQAGADALRAYAEERGGWSEAVADGFAAAVRVATFMRRPKADGPL